MRVPVANRVGEENAGWKLVTNQLNHERVALVSPAPIFGCLREVREWAQNTKDAGGTRLIDSEWVQLNLARVHAKAEVLKLINWELASSQVGRRTLDRHRPMRRRPRCSVPSWPPRPTGC